jgi:peptide/nickel transport system ATP-binding protein
MSLLEVSISADYRGQRDVLRDASFEIGPGEILGLVGQSGAGKSTIALAILGLLEYKGGAVRGRIGFQGRDLLRLPERELRHVRGRQIALVPQSPIASLNPALRIGSQLAEAWKAHSREPIARGELAALLRSVSIPADEAFLRKYPRELSVGLAQRVLIAMAILHRPPLIIADEPTSALDMVTQAEILSLFARLNRELRTAILYISHDLVSVASVCHRVAILHGGEIVETGAVEQIFQSPAHPYTQKLVGSAAALSMSRLLPARQTAPPVPCI